MIGKMEIETLKLCIGKHQVGAIILFILSSLVYVFAITGNMTIEPRLNIVGIVIGIIGYSFCCDLLLRSYWLNKELKKSNSHLKTDNV